MEKWVRNASVGLARATSRRDFLAGMARGLVGMGLGAAGLGVDRPE